MAKVHTVQRGNTWQYYFEAAKINGKRTRIQKCGFSSEKEAERAGVKALFEYNHVGQHFEISEISFNDFLDLWWEQYAEINFKPETLKNYGKKIKNHIRPAFGRYKLKTLNPSILQNFINNKFNEGYSRNSLATMRGILSQSLIYAVEPLGLIKQSPMIYVKLPSPRAKAKVATRENGHVYIGKEMIKKIFDRFPETTSTHIPMMFAYRCGTRQAESFAFFWEDIDFENAKISVNRQVQWDEKNKVWYFSDPKYDSFRTIEIDNDFLELLKREKGRQDFAIGYYGNHYTRIYENEKRQINTVGDGQEIHLVCVRPNGEFIIPRTMQHTSRIIHYEMDFPEFDMHSLRVTHATMLVDSNAPPKYVQLRLGHKNIQVTLQFYTRFTEALSDHGRSILNAMY